jgi:hypothetical protein
MKYIKQSRLKLVFYSVHLLLIEAVLKLLFPAFPLVELMSAQGVLIGGYLGAKTANNIKDKKNGNEIITGD